LEVSLATWLWVTVTTKVVGPRWLFVRELDRVPPFATATSVSDMELPHGESPGVRSLAEFVRHARGLAERFNEPTTVSFRIEWHGLQGRVIRDPWNMWLDQWTARGDHRVAADTWPITMLKDAWPEIVANLAAPVMRAFTTDIALSPTWVRGQSSKWLSYG
jgi:hypothetical protein